MNTATPWFLRTGSRSPYYSVRIIRKDNSRNDPSSLRENHYAIRTDENRDQSGGDTRSRGGRA